MTLPQVSTDENAPVYLVTDFDDSAEVRSEVMTSESSSTRSMSTLSSGEVAEYFKTLHGFTYVTDDNVPLAFPTDAVAERVNIVFNIITRLCQGGKNVPGIADELLARGGLDGGGARVLSLVTNSGVWAYEVAGAYPNAEIVSIDVKPLTALVPHERIKFEVYNVYAGIAEPDASFDVVHARQCVTLVKDYNFMIREMHRVLKPGGLLVIGEMPSQSYEARDPAISLRTSPMRAEAIALMRRAHAAQGIDLAAWDEMSQRLDPRHPMWENNDPDTKTMTSSSVHGFRNITTFTHLIPNGPWSNEESQRVIGAMAKLIFEKAWKALPPMLRMMGMDEDAANTFLARLDAEVQDPRYRSYAKYKTWCARKI